MINAYGLDISYFESRLDTLRDLTRYKPSELARELHRMAIAADDNVIFEQEFSNFKDDLINRLCEENIILRNKLANNKS